MQDDFSQILQNMTPEEQEKFSALGSSDERQAALQDQIRQAQALRHSNMAQGHSSPIGAALAGLGDVVNIGHGAAQDKDLRGQQQALYADQDRMRGRFTQLMGQGAPQQPQAPQAPPAAGMDPAMAQQMAQAQALRGNQSPAGWRNSPQPGEEGFLDDPLGLGLMGGR